MAEPTSSRHEKSLGLLTTKFVSLLQQAKDGVLDLKVAADTLAVRQKRRIYDITNVLEGIGLIEKKSKNSIQWKGAGPGSNSRETSERLNHLKEEIAEMERREYELDEHKSWVTQSIKNVTDDVGNHQHAYVTHEDICRCFKGDTLLAIQAPSGTQLEVPIPEGQVNRKKKYQIHLKSHSGPIYVLLVNKDTEETSPVVVQVPPPKDESEIFEQQRHSPANQNTDPLLGRTSTYRPGPRVGLSKSPLRPSQASASLLDAAGPSRMATRSSPRKAQEQQLHAPLTLPASSTADPLSANTDLFFDAISAPTDGEFIDDLMSSEMFAPLLRLSPPPSDRDYYFNLDDSEGVCDLFDVPLI